MVVFFILLLSLFNDDIIILNIFYVTAMLPMIHRNKHGRKLRSTASDIVLNNKKILFAVGIELLK